MYKGTLMRKRKRTRVVVNGISKKRKGDKVRCYKQPRYFCKACRRYWTQGGTLRNVPLGGGSRKGKRAKSSIFFKWRGFQISTTAASSGNSGNLG